MRRESAIYRRRTSVQIVKETRGLPLTIYSYLMATLWLITGIRNIFWCDSPIFGTPEEREQLGKMFPNCKDGNEYAQFTADLLAVFDLMFAFIRFHMASTTRVADLYLTLCMLVLGDFMFLASMLRLGYEKNPLVYQVLVGGSTIHEVYTLLEARKAHMARSKMKKVLETGDPDHKD